MSPLAAVDPSTRLSIVAIVMAFGFLVGIVGHIVRSRTIIVTGIIIIAIASVYVVYVPGS